MPIDRERDRLDMVLKDHPSFPVRGRFCHGLIYLPQSLRASRRSVCEKTTTVASTLCRGLADDQHAMTVAATSEFMA
jgi:hypothetical protein